MLLFFLIIISYDCIFMSLLLKLPTFSRVRRDGASILSFYILATKATVASEMSTVNSLVKIIAAWFTVEHLLFSLSFC